MRAIPAATRDPLRADPLRIPPRNPLYADDDDDDPSRLRDPRYRPRGDFDDDLNPLAIPGSGGGSLMGPRSFPHGGGGVRPGVPGMAPRYDPYGPVPGMGEPDFDELMPPGMGGEGRGPRGPFGAGGLGRGGGGLGGGGGFPRGGGGPFM